MHYQHTSVRYDTRNDRLFQRSLYSFEGVGIIMSKFKKQNIYVRKLKLYINAYYIRTVRVREHFI